MSKTIKVEDHVYTELTKLQGVRETYSQTVQRLINVNYDVMRFFDRIAADKTSTMPRTGGNGGRST